VIDLGGFRSPSVSGFARDARFVTRLRMKDFFDEAGHKPAASGKK